MKAFTLIEMLVATALTAVLMGGVLMLLGGAHRDAQTLRQKSVSTADGIFALLQHDLSNSTEMSQSLDGRMIELSGNIGIDARARIPNGRLARVAYRVTPGGNLRREQRYADAPERPEPWNELVAMNIDALSVATIAGDPTRVRMVMETNGQTIAREEDTMKQFNRIRACRGYVLVVTLGLLVLSATVMVGLSRLGLQQVRASRAAAAEFQRRIGSASLRSAMLPHARSILAIHEARQGKPTAFLRERIMLGSQSFEIIVGDEQAKANLNRMIVDSDAASVESRLREALAGTGLGRTVQMHALPRSAISGDNLPGFVTGVGQVFDLTRVTPTQLLKRTRGIAPLDVVTLWGDGRLNIRRASEESAKLALQPMLTTIEVRRLLDAKSSSNLLQAAGLPLSIGGRSIPVTTASDCFSVWIIANDGLREFVELEVLDTSDRNQPQRAYFSW